MHRGAARADAHRVQAAVAAPPGRGDRGGDLETDLVRGLLEHGDLRLAVAREGVDLQRHAVVGPRLGEPDRRPPGALDRSREDLERVGDGVGDDLRQGGTGRRAAVVPGGDVEHHPAAPQVRPILTSLDSVGERLHEVPGVSGHRSAGTRTPRAPTRDAARTRRAGPPRSPHPRSWNTRILTHAHQDGQPPRIVGGRCSAWANGGAPGLRHERTSIEA